MMLYALCIFMYFFLCILFFGVLTSDEIAALMEGFANDWNFGPGEPGWFSTPRLDSGFEAADVSWILGYPEHPQATGKPSWICGPLWTAKLRPPSVLKELPLCIVSAFSGVLDEMGDARMYG